MTSTLLSTFISYFTSQYSILYMKLTFGIIVLNGDFFLKQVLDSIYPFAHAICIAEGPVGYWYDKGVRCSTDDTNKILEKYPDPDRKLRIVHGHWAEKTEQCQAWFRHVPADTDYVVCRDADEIISAGDMVKLIDYLHAVQPTSVGFKSNTFYGGFTHCMGGFEAQHSFKRVLKYEKGSTYLTHRQPTLALDGKPIEGKDITGQQLYDATGITMWHGSYVSPHGVYDKLRYYEDAIIAKGKCIPYYFKEVWLQWVLYPEKREEIEKKYRGVHEFSPSIREDCYTIPFTGQHPEVIVRDMAELQAKFDEQLKLYVK